MRWFEMLERSVSSPRRRRRRLQRNGTEWERNART
jgi:hypothetical protein